MELLVHGPGIEARIALAKALGHKEILLLFTKEQKDAGVIAKKLGVKSALLISSLQQAKRKGYDYIIAPCKREFFESKAVDFILEPEDASRGDFIHHRNSGLNQVLLNFCKATSKRKAKGIITSSSLLLNARKPLTILGRMLQNGRWCKKYKVPYHVTSGATSIWQQRDAKSMAALEHFLS